MNSSITAGVVFIKCVKLNESIAFRYDIPAKSTPLIVTHHATSFKIETVWYLASTLFIWFWQITWQPKASHLVIDWLFIRTVTLVDPVPVWTQYSSCERSRAKEAGRSTSWAFFEGSVQHFQQSPAFNYCSCYLSGGVIFSRSVVCWTSASVFRIIRHNKSWRSSRA